MQARVKKGDTVLVLSGKDKGKKSKVIRVLKEDNKVIVEKVSVAKRHQRQTQKSPGGIVDKLLPIHVSKVMVVCPHCGKASRLRKKDSFRACGKCGEVIDKGN